MSFLSTKGKKYGLIIPDRKKPAAKAALRPSAFGDSSSDEESDGKKHVNVALKRQHEKTKNQTDETAARALAEDPSIFEYDSLYDKMTEEKKMKNPKLLRDTKPKYIQALKRAAERRKLEGELVYEHMAQKEIEKDREEFKDKESFVTSAYKKKLAERKALEEELAREAAIEEANDVTKQKDLSRFHKHLFKQVVSPSEKSESEQPPDSGKKDGSHSKSGEEGEREDTRERRKSYDAEGRQDDRERENSRRSSDRERDRKNSSDDYHHSRRRSSHGERRDSHGRRERSPEPHQRQERAAADDKTSPPAEGAEKQSDKDGPTTTEPPKKKTKIRAGIEVEVEEITPVVRRKQAAAKKTTAETMMSAKERYLARKKVKTETVTRRLSSTSDD